jgi:tetratricopeptide (TPR) repeat protein
MSYTVREVAAMLGLKPAQIRAYATEGFLKPERGVRGELRFGFHDLVILRTAGELSSAHIPRRKVRRALQRLRDQLPDGASLTGVRIAADGDHVVVRDGEAIWIPESGQALFDFAVAELMEKATPFGRRPNLADARTADDWYEIACDAEGTSTEDAQRAYERALELDDEHADAHVNLGRLLHEEGAPADAEEHYRRAIEIDPDHETAAFNLGVALEDLGRMAGAIDSYKRAILIDPANADAHYNLAGIYERRGDKASALRYLKTYAKLKKG